MSFSENTSKEQITEWLKGLQDSICKALEQADGQAAFTEELWTREEGGGGRSRVIEQGAVLEKGGVMFSAVHGHTPDFLTKEREHAITGDNAERSTFYATGVSIVLHPQSPMVPIIHMNIRYFEMSNGVKWLGGGIDLTPHYIVDDDARFFHQSLKTLCDRHHAGYYGKFKAWADDYFFIKHRNETRGIGGIFFDRLHAGEGMSFEQNLAFWKEVGEAFAPIYTELIARNSHKPYNDTHKQWQMIRRGRYVEFNLVYDKGTKFGLETNGRVESILMSLPPTASWLYNFVPPPGSEEEKTTKRLRKSSDYLQFE